MRKMFVLLVFLVGPAWADWSTIGKNAEFTMYGDANSIQRKGSLVTFWVMGDYKTTQSQKFPPPLLWLNFDSVKELKELDCARGLHRTLKTIIHSGRLARGDVLYSYGSNAEFAPVARVEMDIAQFNFGCDAGKN